MSADNSRNKKDNSFVKWIKSPSFDVILFVILVVLVNLVASRAYLRFDLTGPSSYSLSDASRELVANVDEPLAVKVFFSKNLPSPYDSVEQYVSDLLQEYDRVSNSNFSYEVYNMDKKENQELARSLGVTQSQVQVIKDNQRSAENVFMGLAITYGDQIEVINPITSSSGFEYLLTSTMNTVIYNTNILGGMKDGLKLTLYKSESLSKIGIQGFDQIEAYVQECVDAVNQKYNGKISFEVKNPSASEVRELNQKYGVQVVSWRNEDRTSETGTLDMVLECGDKNRLLHIGIVNSFFGYMTTGLEDFDYELENNIKGILARTSVVAYITGHDELSITDANSLSAVNLNYLLEDSYFLEEVNLQEQELPSYIQSVIINGPRTPFTQKELYALDQFLMKGGNLILFLDSFAEQYDEYSAYYGYSEPEFVAVDTGLEDLIKKYGIELNKEYVMDKSCYTDVDSQYGTVNFYYAPAIYDKGLNQKSPISKNLGFVLFLQTGSLDASVAMENPDVKVTPLAVSSEESWGLTENIYLSPLMITPPADKSQMHSRVLALTAEGKFNSAFDAAVEDEIEDSDTTVSDDSFSTDSHVASSVQSAKIFVAATSAITTQQILSESSDQPIAYFVRNAVDALNGNESLCEMRTKGLSLNSLKVQSGPWANFVKYFNEAGLAILVALAGLFVYLGRRAHRNAISMKYDPCDSREMDSKENSEEV